MRVVVVLVIFIILYSPFLVLQLFSDLRSSSFFLSFQHFISFFRPEVCCLNLLRCRRWRGVGAIRSTVAAWWMIFDFHDLCFCLTQIRKIVLCAI